MALAPRRLQENDLFGRNERGRCAMTGCTQSIHRRHHTLLTMAMQAVASDMEGMTLDR